MASQDYGCAVVQRLHSFDFYTIFLNNGQEKTSDSFILPPKIPQYK
jgi:hypothetical protein